MTVSSKNKRKTFEELMDEYPRFFLNIYKISSLDDPWRINSS